MSFFKRVWFLDCFGHVISYRPLTERIFRIPIHGTLTHGFIASPFPLQGPIEPTWWTLYGQQIPIEPLLITPQHNNLVSIRKRDSQEYLSIDIHSDITPFVPHFQTWEEFLPVSEEIIQGIILASDPDMTQITAAGSQERINLTHIPSDPSKPGAHYIGNEAIRTCDDHNLEIFKRIGKLEINETIKVSFSGYDTVRTKEYTIFCRSHTP